MNPVDIGAIRARVKQIGHAGAFDTQDLLALIDQQTRALLEVERREENAYDKTHDMEVPIGAFCPACGAAGKRTENMQDPGSLGWREAEVAGEHEPDCPIDAALTAAGLDTQEKRDAKRKELGLR